MDSQLGAESIGSLIAALINSRNIMEMLYAEMLFLEISILNKQSSISRKCRMTFWLCYITAVPLTRRRDTSIALQRKIHGVNLKDLALLKTKTTIWSQSSWSFSSQFLKSSAVLLRKLTIAVDEAHLVL